MKKNAFKIRENDKLSKQFAIDLEGAQKMGVPKVIKPMLATLVDKVPPGDNWIYEIKWDGYRVISLCKGNEIQLISRNNKSFNIKFYPIVEHLQKLKLHAILDGEIVVLKQSGVASFEALQNWRSEADGTLIYYLFDLLWLNGYSLLNLPLLKRKALLKQILPTSGSIKESKSFRGSASEFLEAIKTMDLEGMIAKRADSTYQPGQRSRDWLKIKAQKSHEAVIGGYTQNIGTTKSFSAILAGIYEEGKLRYIGKIGTGFNDKVQHELMKKFKELTIKKCPFAIEPDVNLPSRFRPNPPHAKVTWLLPKLVCEVRYTEMTQDGVMRHPSFKGLREDKNAEEVHAEVPEKISKIPKKLVSKISPVKESQRRTLLNPTEETQTKLIQGHELKFNNLSKVFWPDDGFTKRDLINYYYQIAPYILPYLKDRPQSLNRFPNGIYSESFYQKDVTRTAPKWIKKVPYRTSEGEDKNYLIAQSEADLLWMANLGAIEMNPWNSTMEKPDYPTWCIIDIDPSEHNTFEQVIETAQVTKQVLDSLKIKGCCKTSGADGMHIYIPLGAKYTFEQCQLFGRMLASFVHTALPTLTSIERYNVKRKSKIYVDFLQNRPLATVAAAYSVRPRRGAPVSMPLHWEEVKKGLNPKQFNIKNAVQRIRSEGDLFKAVLGRGINIDKALKALQSLI